MAAFGARLESDQSGGELDKQRTYFRGTFGSSQGMLVQSFQLAEPLLTDLGLKEGSELISTQREKKKRRRGMIGPDLLQIPRR